MIMIMKVVQCSTKVLSDRVVEWFFFFGAYLI